MRSDQKWGECRCSDEHVVKYVHPDDIEMFLKHRPGYHMVECVGEGNGYLVVTFQDERYRIRPEGFFPLPTPEHGYGDRVRAQTKGKHLDCTVSRIVWHHKRS